jgi:hypothetical protein
MAAYATLRLGLLSLDVALLGRLPNKTFFLVYILVLQSQGEITILQGQPGSLGNMGRRNDGPVGAVGEHRMKEFRILCDELAQVLLILFSS